MKISVIIPTRSINDYITQENLPSYTNQTYKNFEVIILPNEKSNLDDALLKKYTWLKIIPTNPITRPAEKRDIGVQHANGEIIAFIDDDAFASYNWLEKAITEFKNHSDEIAAVCGPGVVPKNAKFWEKVFDAILRTWIGAGGFSYRFIPGTAKFVDDYPSMNFLIKKKVFKKLGGFNSQYWPGEDSKLCEDIVYKEKKKIYYSPNVLVYHHRRNSLIAYLKQHANYGFHRGAFFAHGDKNSRRLSYLIPSFFCIYLILLIITLVSPVKNIILVIPLFLYIAAETYLFLKIFTTSRNIKIASAAVLVLFLTHLIYGIVFIKGYITGKTKHEKIYN